MNARLRHLLTLLFVLVAMAARAQDITTLDWAEMKIDTVLPYYTEVVPLESDYRRYDYTVRVEYPEWGALNAREQEAIQKFADQIKDSLEVETYVGVSRKVGVLDISFVPIICKNGEYQKLLSAKISITPVAKKMVRRLGSVTEAERWTKNSKLSTGTWVKISVTDDGMYRLTRSDLQRMGFSNPDNVHLYGYGGHRLPEVFKMENFYDDLVEMPFHKVDNDTWVFWCNGLVHWNGNTRVFNQYATEACYFLTEESVSSTTPTADVISTTPSNVVSTFTDHVLHEKDEFSWFHGGRNLVESTNYANSNVHSYGLSTINSAGDEKLTVCFTAGNDVATTVTPTVNGTALSTMTISAVEKYVYAVSSTRTFDVADYRGSDDWNIRLTSTSGNNARLDYLAMHYSRKLIPNEGYVAFRGEGSGVTQFDIMGSGLCVLRIPEPGVTAEYENGTQNGSTFQVVVEDPTARYVAFDPSYGFPKPTVVGTIDNQNLHALDSLDMVIIVPESGKLTSEAERLAQAHRDYDGLSVEVVNAGDIYNEFSSGTRDATAYRLFMKMLYDRAASDDVAPKYLLLFGDCAWDNRMIGSAWKYYSPEDYLLCFESENSYSDTRCYVMEDYFGLLDDGEGNYLVNDKTDVGVGRFPVTSVGEAKIMVDKSINFLTNSNAGNWKNIISVIGDDGDNNEHMRYADDVAERVLTYNPEMEVRKVMFDAFTRVSSISSNTYPEVSELLKEQMSNGAMVMNYTGHAATYCLSHEFVLVLEDFTSTKSKFLPLWMTAACDVMPFDGQSANIGETAVLNDGGAALAFFGTSRTVYAYNNLQMNRQFMYYLLGTDANGKRYRLGDAVRLAKVSLITNSLETSNRENKLHYALLGDPALIIGAPSNRVVLDSINGQSLDANIHLKAGQHVRMSGHIENGSGDMLSGFHGTLSARVYDNLETVTCLNNAGASSAFTFTNREKVLYNGQDSVANGRFAIEFVIPKDINNSNLSGRVVFYAINDSLEVEANGYSEEFLVGGTAGNDDNIGPEILAYLNTEDFENGDKVNSTPYFFAYLNDESGISYSGNGLGHDLLLTVDNNPETTFVLNNYYTSNFGDYTTGTVGYSIPTLEDGNHSLTFRAWDVLNNTSAVSLDFVVDSSLKPSLLNLYASPTIATTSTNFVLTYDRPGSNIDFTIEVFDFAGRRMWHHTETGASASGVYVIPWNLTMQGGGRVGPGVYLYRATIVSGDSKEVNKTQKIIVNGNNR